jgi:hypothetical protein
MSTDAMKSDLLDILMTLHHSTDRAVLASDDGDRARAVWLPLAQIEVETRPDGYALVTLPEWLAIEKGLV